VEYLLIAIKKYLLIFLPLLVSINKLKKYINYMQICKTIKYYIISKFFIFSVTLKKK